MVENHDDYEGESTEEREEEEEPNFSDPEGFIDDITDDELLEDIIRLGHWRLSGENVNTRMTWSA